MSLGTLRVEVTAGPALGLATTLDADQVSIGSAKGNGLVVGDPTVSRFHLELMRDGGDILVSDLGSTNGTYVGPVRITQPTTIGLGVQVRVGKTILELRK